MRRTFVVGRMDGKTTEIRMVEKAAPPISGPFAVTAVVRPTRTTASAEP